VSWFLTTDLHEFLRIRHDMLLTFMRIISENGSSFAFPSRTVYHIQQDGATTVPIIGASTPAANA
jgi:MscS family membrane protein